MPHSRRKSARNTIGRGNSATRRDRRNAQEQSKGRINELEEKWEALLESEKDSLLHRLVRENRELETTFQQYQSKIESIILLSKECLEGTQNVKLDNNISGIQNLHPSQLISRAGSVLQADDITMLEPEKTSSPPRRNLPPVTLYPSIVFQATLLTSGASTKLQEFAPNVLCESVIAWKGKNGQGLGSSFLLGHFQPEKLVSLFEKRRAMELMASPNFYQSLLESLLSGTELNLPPDQSNTQGTPPQGASRMMHERCGVVLCAYILAEQYRPYHVSQLVFIANFWLLFTFLMFLTFPTEENLNKMPVWMWPTNSQLRHEHPGLIDFLLWPQLRSALVQSWRTYNLVDFCVDFAQSLELQDCYSGTPIKLSASMSHLEIDSAFEKAIFDLRNHRLSSHFCHKYPNLMQYVNPLENVIYAQPTTPERQSTHSADVSGII